MGVVSTKIMDFLIGLVAYLIPLYTLSYREPLCIYPARIYLRCALASIRYLILAGR